MAKYQYFATRTVIILLPPPEIARTSLSLRHIYFNNNYDQSSCYDYLWALCSQIIMTICWFDVPRQNYEFNFFFFPSENCWQAHTKGASHTIWHLALSSGRHYLQWVSCGYQYSKFLMVYVKLTSFARSMNKLRYFLIRNWS